MAIIVAMSVIVSVAHADDGSYAEITNLQHEFIETLDQRDYAGLAAMFSNGTLVIARPDLAEPPSATGEPAVAQMLATTLPPPMATAFGRHIASNLIIEIDEDAGTATARMYTAAYLVVEGRPAHFLGAGRHQHRFVRNDGVWEFAEKVITGDAFFPPQN
ncbi:MAG: nuclear transport factor 2 family protein [Candidatus Devosia phytovorans]|uniref:Nuclear transport factor 2 family protein n=1 Tax=Candidatus Devosia phytovorans TaxID=3121372 RepID=A0AAJ6AXX5_9HYPH|nr:nuclear transport factor 2 family protein [Devosia sp.]WEK02975.1 MAG: nuclear transport factor 2 family protein [Devosia sp.]